jgi:hypothetical protein
MQTIVKWLVGAALGWLADFISNLWAKYQERKRVEKEREDANKAAEKKLEEARSEEEVIDAGSEHLRR